MEKQQKRSNLRPVSNSRSQLLETGLKGLKSTKAFTLVELIVVITILAILGTIAFISLQGYSQDARDSVRISDMSKIKTSLELFQLDVGKYPETTTPTSITYSGAIAWTQGMFGEATFNNVTKLDKIPKDPLTDRQYVYSVTNTKQEYQLAGIMEGDEVTGLLNQTNAALKTAMLKITGNYNGKVLKLSTGATDYVLAVPSIITSSGITVDQIISSKFLAYNGYKNLPAEYAGSSYDLLGDSTIKLVNNSDLVVYSGDLKTLSDTTGTGTTARNNLIIKLQNAYVGTAITNVGEIARIINTQTTDSTATELLGATIVSNDLGGSIAINLLIPIQFLSNCTASGQIYYTDNGGNKLASVTNTGATTWKSGKSISDLTCAGHIIMCSGNNAGYILQACNLGANTVGTTGTGSYGGLFQWGNHYDFRNNQFTNFGAYPTTGLVRIPITDYSTCSKSVFIKKTDWASTDSSGTLRSANWNPCATGYHVPTNTQWAAINSAGSWGTTLGTYMMNTLKLPLAGNRDWYDALLYDQASKGYYWASSANGTSGYSLDINSTIIAPSGVNYRAKGFSLRCLKN